MPEVSKEVLEELKQAALSLKNAQNDARELAATVAEHEKRFLDNEKILAALKRGRQEVRQIEASSFINKETKVPFVVSEDLTAFVALTMKQEATWMQKNFPDYLRQKADLETSLAASDNPALGGYLVPEGFYPEIWKFMIQRSQYLQVCRRLGMQGIQTMKYPARNSGWTVSWPGESLPIDQGEPDYGQINYVAKKLASYGQISRELLMFSAPDIMADLVLGAIEASGQEIDRVGFTGTTVASADVADGILNWTMTNTAYAIASTTFSPTYQELINGVYQLSTQLLQNTRFLMSPSVFGQIKQMTDDNNMPVWVPTAGSPDSNTIVGFPYTLVDALPAYSSTPPAVDTPFMLFGNFKHVPYGDVRGFRFERSDEFLFSSDQVALKFTQFIAFPDLTNAPLVEDTIVKWQTAPTP